MSTNAYSAGFETNSVEVSYGLEAVWGVAPATAFQAIRLTGESLAGKKQRTRPNEINTSGEVSAAVTQQVTADGTINFALSYGVYDDMMASFLASAWAGVNTIASVAGDITLAAGGAISSTTAGKFTNVVVGQWLRITTPLNVGYARVSAKADATHITVTGMTLVNETPAGTTASIKSSGYIRNSNVFQSLFFQKKFSSAIWLTYPGSFVHGWTLNANQGQFAEGNFTVMSKIETSATADSSTGGVTAAPTNVVFDTVAEFAQLQLDGAVIAAVCKGVSLQMTRVGAAGEYGLGSASAQGMILGQFQLDGGKASFYFKDLTLYAMYLAEAYHTFSYRQTDLAGNSYIFTVNNAVLINPTIVASAPNGAVMADFTLEANPGGTLGTFQVDRIAA